MHAFRRIGTRVGRLLLAAHGWLVIGFLLLPVAAVVPMSFNDLGVFELIPTNPSLAQYRKLFESPDWMEVMWRSMRIAVLVTMAATTLGILAASAVARLSPRLRAATEAVFLAPQIVPSVVIAASAYFLFARFGLVGTMTGIVIMHTVIAVPFVVILMGSRLQSLSPDMAQASASLGAGPLRTFLRVIVPQVGTAIAGSALLAFHASFDEVVLSLFLSGARNKTLPVKLWDAILFEVSPILPAISTVVMLIPLAAVLPLLVLRARR
ncbi:MAG: ABC transporter permease [Alphaproteobacteria bacterium]|nr:ABC transporter permease [Alphaproteobacteria bacterium]